MKVFYTKRGLDSYLFLMLLACVIAFTPLFLNAEKDKKFTLIISSLAFMHNLWQLKTRYIILEDGCLQINYLFIKRKINISDIFKIESGKRYQFHNRGYASSLQGLMMSIGNKSIFITPMNEEVFIEELVKINPSIQLK
jgi:hypothetical protein